MTALVPAHTGSRLSLPAHSVSGPPLPPAPEADPREQQKPGRKKRVVAAIAAVLLIAGGGYALSTGAAFTDTHVVDGNTVGTASLQIGETVETPVNVSNLLPGQVQTTADVLTFENTGTVPFSYEATVTNISTSEGAPEALPGWIPVVLTIGDVSESGTLAAPPSISVDSLDPEGTATIGVTVGLLGAADNSAQGSSASFDLNITAEQIN